MNEDASPVPRVARANEPAREAHADGAAPAAGAGAFARLGGVAGGLLGGTGVAMRAFAAHGGALIGDARHQAMFRDATDLQLVHALALLAAASLARRERILAPVAIVGLLAGTLGFTTSVGGLALGWFDTGKLAPVSGTILIAAWFVLAAAYGRAR